MCTRCAVLASSTFGAAFAQAVGECHGFPRRIVRQAQHHQVHLRHHVAAGGRVPAALGGQAAQLDAGQRGEALADAEARGAGFAVDEDAGLVGIEVLRPG